MLGLTDVVRIPLLRHPTTVAGSHELLDEFIAGPENRLLCHVALSAETVIQRGNPWLLVGPSGVGKTALARYLAFKQTGSEPPSKVVFEPASEFARRYAEAVDADDIDHFRTRYHRAEFWMIDDVQDIASKPAAQQELASRIDQCVKSGIAIIATCRVLPIQVRGLSNALASRLLPGLTIPISPPEAVARRAILRDLSTKLDLDLAEPQIVELEERLPPRLVARRFAAALQQIVLQRATQKQTPLGLPPSDNLDAVLDTHHEPTIAAIAAAVSRKMKVRASDLRGNTRRQTVVQARSLAMYLSRQLTGGSLQQIGKYFGGRDHSTVLHALRKTTEALRVEPDVARLAQELADQLRAG